MGVKEGQGAKYAIEKEMNCPAVLNRVDPSAFTA